MTTRQIVVLGGGLAGHSAAETLRNEGFEGELTIVEAEPVVPYDRTVLSKAVLQGSRSADSASFRSPEHYENLRITLELDQTVTDVDLRARELTTNHGRRFSYDKLLIATGTSPLRLPVPGADLPGVHYLRTVADAEALRRDLDMAQQVAVIGAGFIGAEVAASARSLQKGVCLVDLLDAPMAGALGREVGDIFATIHESHGVALRMRSRVLELRGHQRVEEIVLSDGTALACDLAVIGIGVRPVTDLFVGTDLDISNGVRVSEACESNLPGVFAAGDVANWWHPRLGQHLRVEHFNNAAEQGVAAAKAMLGQPVSYSPVPYFWSDQYDVNLQYAGHAGPNAEVVLRRYPERNAVTAFYLRDSCVEAVAAINRGRDIRPSRRLIESRQTVDRDVLADPDQDLRSILA